MLLYLPTLLFISMAFCCHMAGIQEKCGRVYLCLSPEAMGDDALGKWNDSMSHINAFLWECIHWSGWSALVNQHAYVSVLSLCDMMDGPFIQYLDLM